MFSKNDLCFHFKFLSLLDLPSIVHRIDTSTKKKKNDMQKCITVRYRNTEDTRRFNIFNGMMMVMQVSKLGSSMLAATRSWTHYFPAPHFKTHKTKHATVVLPVAFFFMRRILVSLSLWAMYWGRFRPKCSVTYLDTRETHLHRTRENYTLGGFIIHTDRVFNEAFSIYDHTA
jgi:hypothetical protein